MLEIDINDLILKYMVNGMSIEPVFKCLFYIIQKNHHPRKYFLCLLFYEASDRIQCIDIAKYT